MCPRLFTIGPFTVYSYGLMVGIGFILASILLTRELKRKGLDQNVGSTVTLFAVVFGLSGSKMLYLIENWSYFVRDPLGMAFSPGGLTWYGGFILATIVIMLYTRKKKILFLKVCDASSPGLALGYGVARIGCHLSGDGDYGMPTDLPWGAVYSQGTFPPSKAFEEFPEIVQQYGVDGVVPDTIPVHPAPLYEFVIGVGLFLILWTLRTKYSSDGKLFMMYLILSGTTRFLVEFIRINPRILFGLSEAQLIAFVFVVIGLIGFQVVTKRQQRITATSL
ncbi:MAG: prolipoprotein diacylglyceryl transferase [Ignavibacteriae bacterium]|nr:prolipoprotein diacylglyceryl transferase [Ignavibacteriota bacterium]